MNYAKKYILQIESDRLGSRGDDARARAEAAMHAALLALPDGGLGACDARERVAYTDMDSLEVIDGDGSRQATAAEREAWGQWIACETAAEAAAYEGWEQWPQSGGLSISVAAR